MRRFEHEMTGINEYLWEHLVDLAQIFGESIHDYA